MPNYRDDGAPALEEIIDNVEADLWEWEYSNEEYGYAARRIVLYILQHPKLDKALIQCAKLALNIKS